MKISIIMSTYNGETYIQEQLESIVSQTVLPDEVIISDDCSSDTTVFIIKKFIKNNKLNNWKLYVNEANLGWKKNFMNLLSQAQGEYIFLCDQDDIWNKSKLSNMVNIMDKKKEILLLASDYYPLYQTADAEKISKKILKTMKSDGTVEKYPFSADFLSVLRPGCTYCIRRNLINISFKYFDDISAHDALLWRVSNLYDGLYIYHTPMIEFRRHGNNSTPKKNEDIQSKKNEMLTKKQIIDIVRYMLSEPEQPLDAIENKKLILSGNKRFYELRYILFDEKKLFIWFKLAFFYRKYYFSNRQLFHDLQILLKFF